MIQEDLICAHLDAVHAHSRDGSDLVLAGARWFQLVKRRKQTVKVVYSRRRHNGDYSTPLSCWWKATRYFLSLDSDLTDA